MAEVVEREDREDKDNNDDRKKEPPRPNIPDLEPRWTFGKKGKEALKKMNEEKGD